MKIVFPMQLEGSNAPVEVASLDAFIEKLNALDSGSFPLGRNRLWHGGIHLSKAGDWHASGAVRAMADGEIVAYRLAKQSAKATLEPEQGQPGEAVDLYTSPSFCLVRHRYEAGEQSKNCCTFYSLYMHIACENSYCSPQAARLVVKGHNVSTYEPELEQVNPQQFRVKPRTTQQAGQSRPLYAIKGAEVKLATPDADPSSYLNPQNESHPYQLVSYANEPGHLFYIAASQLEQVFPQKPAWMTPPESKPLRYGVRNNSWLRQSASSTEGSLGVPAGSEVVVSTDRQMVTLTGGPTEFRKVKVFKVGSGSVQDSAGHGMPNANQGDIGWLAKNRLGAELAAEPTTPIEFDKVVDRSQSPMAVQAGEIIGHWGEHQAATANPSTASNTEQKAVHFEVFVAHKDKQALEDCLNNKAQLTDGQRYLRLEEQVTTYRLISNSRHDYQDVAKFGPLILSLAVQESDIVSHGSNQFVKVRERAAAQGEQAGEFVLVTGDTQLVSQHDWGKLGVMLIDGSHDQDGFLDKADTTTSSEEPRQKEASQFFSSLYDKLVTDRDSDGTLSGNDIKAAFADAELAGKLRRLFIKHESEWIKRESWPRLEQELTDMPNLCKYAKQVHQNMAWIDDAKVVEILGDTKPWFIHPAGMMGLVMINDTPSLKIDYDFIHSLEGGIVLNGYVPEPENSQSGVTISVGFDLGARNLPDLNRLELNSFLISKLTPYLGRKKHQAERFVRENPLTITANEANEIYLAVKKNSTNELIIKYNLESTIKFESLPKEAQTVIASVEYQYGSIKTRAPAFWTQVVNQEWQDAHDNLLDFGDDYNTRRRKEAEYLEGIL